MLRFLLKKWLKYKKAYELERDAILTEFQQIGIILKIRNLKGLIEAHKTDIELNGKDIKDLEADVERRRRATDDDLRRIFTDEMVEKIESERGLFAGVKIPEEYKQYFMEQKEPSDSPFNFVEGKQKEFFEHLHRDNNNKISENQAQIANYKKLTEQFNKDIEGFQLEINGRKAQNGAPEIKGLNMQQMGYKTRAEELRMQAKELRSRF